MRHLVVALLLIAFAGIVPADSPPTDEDAMRQQFRGYIARMYEAARGGYGGCPQDIDTCKPGQEYITVCFINPMGKCVCVQQTC